MTEANALTRQLAGQATRALGLTKRAMYASANNTFDQQLDLERDLQREAGKSEDYREGVAAFKEKRPARFTGQ
jgi:2-(1,2-epoxy-1,2-dihydrophenyl)acetyl-CoA isomerase